MINILLVEDNREKIKNIVKVVTPFLGEKIVLDRANDINSAITILRQKNIDIMILDIYLPRIFGDDDQQDGGIALLKTLRKSKTYSKLFVGNVFRRFLYERRFGHENERAFDFYNDNLSWWTRSSSYGTCERKFIGWQ